MPLPSITTAVTDALDEKLLTITETDATGNVIMRERRTTANHAMTCWRCAWNVAARRNPGKVQAVNPFARMGLQSSDRKTPTASYTELEWLVGMEWPYDSAIEIFGAGEGNRTLVISLEGCCSTIELHPRQGDNHRTSAIRSLAFGMTGPCFALPGMVGEVGLEPTKA
jgi:hypothetical protein